MNYAIIWLLVLLLVPTSAAAQTSLKDSLQQCIGVFGWISLVDDKDGELSLGLSCIGTPAERLWVALQDVDTGNRPDIRKAGGVSCQRSGGSQMICVIHIESTKHLNKALGL